MRAKITCLLISIVFATTTAAAMAQETPDPLATATVVDIHVDSADRLIASDTFELLETLLFDHDIRIQTVEGVIRKPYAVWLVDNKAGDTVPDSDHFMSVGTGWNIPLDLPQSPLLREDFVEIVVGRANHEAQAAYLAGVVLYTLDRCDEALTYFESFESPDEDHGEAALFLNDSIAFFSGVCALRREDYAEAVRQLEPVVYEREADQRPEAAVVNLGWLYLRADRDAEAFALLDDYVGNVADVRDTPSVSQIDRLTIRAQFYALNADFDAALRDMDTAIASASTYLASLDTLAKLYVERGQIRVLTYEWDAVLDDYNAAVETSPRYADAYYYRGLLYYTTLVDRENALPDFEHYLELYPDGPFAADAAQYIADIEAELKALEK